MKVAAFGGDRQVAVLVDRRIIQLMPANCAPGTVSTLVYGRLFVTAPLSLSGRSYDGQHFVRLFCLSVYRVFVYYASIQQVLAVADEPARRNRVVDRSRR